MSIPSTTVLLAKTWHKIVQNEKTSFVIMSKIKSLGKK